MVPAQQENSALVGQRLANRIYVMLIVIPLARLTVTAFLDHPRVYEAFSGEVAYVVEGRHSYYVGIILRIGLIALLVLLAPHYVRLIRLNSLKRRYTAGHLLLLIPILWVFVSPSQSTANSIVDSMLLAVAVFMASAMVDIEAFGRLLLKVAICFVAVQVLALSILSTAWHSCRADKCSLTGLLAAGTFPHENLLGIYIASLFGTVHLVKTRRRRTVWVACLLILLVLTGSRTGIVMSALGILFALNPKNERRMKVVPLLMFALSGVLFFSASSLALTGRGAVYSALRKLLEGNWLVGLGSEDMSLINSNGFLGNFAPQHEHSEFGMVVANFGFLGVLMFALAFLSARHAADLTTGRTIGLILISTAFSTEPSLIFQLNSPFMWVVLPWLALTSTVTGYKSQEPKQRQ